MTTKSDVKKSNIGKSFLVVIGVLAGVYLLIMAVMLASDWYKVRPYKAIAAELNQALGGGYKTSYEWHCGLDYSNCPSARMLKDASFKDNEEAKSSIQNYKSSLQKIGYEYIVIGLCEPDQYFVVYCTLGAKKDGKVITINAKKDFIGIDIQP